MNPRVKDVRPNHDFTLTLLFENGEMRVFDVKPYLDKGIFCQLKDLKAFNSVRPFLGSIRWQGGQDFCPDTLYLDSAPVTEPLSAFPAGSPVTEGALTNHCG